MPGRGSYGTPIQGVDAVIELTAITGTTPPVIVIKNSTGTSNTVTVPLATTSPGIYSVDYSGAGYGVILHSNYSLVSPSSPLGSAARSFMFQ